MRNKQFDFMLAVGIVFVVMCHSFQPQLLFYPAFSFHMPLFFFISGYFFKPASSLSGKGLLLIKKAKKQLIPYFALNLLFGIITMLLATKGIRLGLGISIESIFVNPFFRADQFHLFLAAWFLLMLFFVNAIACIVYTDKPKFNYVIIAIALILLIPVLIQGRSRAVAGISGWTSVAIKIYIGFGYFTIGYLFRSIEPKIKKYIIKPVTLAILFLLVDIIKTNFGPYTMNLLFGDIGNDKVMAPLITSVSIILIIYIIAHYASQILKENSIAYTIGRSTFSIMVWQFVGFFILNSIFYFIGLIPFTSLSDVYFHLNVERLWPLYFIAGISIPVLISKGYNVVFKEIRQKMKSKIKIDMRKKT